MTENDWKLYWMNEAQGITEDVAATVEAMCGMCVSADIDYAPYLVQVLNVIVDWLEL